MSKRRVAILLSCLLYTTTAPVLAADTVSSKAADIVEAKDTPTAASDTNVGTNDTKKDVEAPSDAANASNDVQKAPKKIDSSNTKPSASPKTETDDKSTSAAEPSAKTEQKTDACTIVEKKASLDPDSFEGQVDGFFGKYVVAPLASVLLWNIPGINSTRDVRKDAHSVVCLDRKSIQDDPNSEKVKAGDTLTVSVGPNSKTSTFKVEKVKAGQIYLDKPIPGDAQKITYHVTRGGGLPLIVFWLLFGAVFFTVFMRFVNFRMFKHGLDLVRGKYDDPDSPGEVSHFQALTTALSATVGLGNIAGVAIAYMLGGAGATFWMIMVGLFGMASKFAEVTLGQQYREIRPDGRIMGGAMYYLSNGLKDIGRPKLGKFLAVFFVLLCVGASFGGGNAFQVYQSLGQIKTNIPLLAESPWIYGLIMTVLAGVVIIGGIKRIANIADKVVPAMCVVYVLVCLYIIVVNAGAIGSAFGAIFSGAFNPDAAFGGIIGVLVVGIQRAVFSNEAGLGSAAIAHSAAKVKYPVEEGFVALLEPFIDTVLICTMTALVLIITDASNVENFETLKGAKDGATLTSLAMGSVVSWFPYVLSVAVFLFAFSTMIAWSYYGERCWVWLFGDRSSMSYRVLFLVFTFLGSVLTGTNILDFSDLMILGMAFPNLLGVILLSKKVRGAMDDYEGKLQSGEIKRTS
jgi:AGCS family alanine or glycine:cation symporter